MREILFRGKTVMGNWRYGDLIHYVGKTVIKEVGEYWVIPESIGQYTGLMDKNGKKIFEGDILKWQTTDGDDVFDLVSYKRGAFVINAEQGFLEPLAEYLYSLDMEVIGNIYDNPEILKGGAE